MRRGTKLPLLRAGIVICPGVGFYAVPTDCMAATLKEALPDATHLVLAFDAGGSMSPGTARTLAQSTRLGQRSGRVRRNGVIEEVPLAHNWRLSISQVALLRRSPSPGGTSLPLGSRPAFPTSRHLSQFRARQRSPAGRSIGYGPYWHRHLGRCCYNDSPIAPADPPKNSYALGDHVCGARCTMKQTSDARRIWKLLTVIA